MARTVAVNAAPAAVNIRWRGSDSTELGPQRLVADGDQPLDRADHDEPDLALAVVDEQDPVAALRYQDAVPDVPSRPAGAQPQPPADQSFADQYRPDQSCPDQYRPDQYRPDQDESTQACLAQSVPGQVAGAQVRDAQEVPVQPSPAIRRPSHIPPFQA